MPELPEVQTLSNQLNAEVLNKKIVGVNVYDSRVSTSSPEILIKILTGRTIKRIGRRGKNLIIYFSSDLAAVIHLMISGRIYHLGQKDELPRGCMLELIFNSNDRLCFCYLYLGYFEIYPASKIDEEPHLKQLGKEALNGIKEKEFAKLLSQSNSSIKSVLLNQHLLAGIGNIYADETLFDSGIAPKRKSSEISEKEAFKLYKSIQKILSQAIPNRGTTIDSWSDLYGDSGNHQYHLKITRKPSQKCFRCGSFIIKTKVAGRTTYYCNNCQK